MPEVQIAGIETWFSGEPCDVVCGKDCASHQLQFTCGSVWFWQLSDQVHMRVFIEGHVPWYFGFIGSVPNYYRLEGEPPSPAEQLRRSELISVRMLYTKVQAHIVHSA